MDRMVVGFSLVLAFLAQSSQASIVLDVGLVGGSGDVQNVLFNSFPGQQGLTVQGALNSTGEIVNFTGVEDLITPPGGQARVEAFDGSFEMIMIELADQALGFDKIQFNIDTAEDGFADITFMDQFGTDFIFADQALDGDGENFFTGRGLDGQVIVKATIDTSVEMTAISDLQQVRLGPTEQTVPNPNPEGQVPEAASFVTWCILGLLYACGAGRRQPYPENA